MIIVQLKGGLGNQLFQYAAGYSLAKYHNTTVKVDIDELLVKNDHDTVRDYELQHLIEPPLIATQQEVDEMVHQPTIVRYFQKTLPPFKRKIYKEKAFEFDENFWNAGSNIYLKGYRQSEKYFKPYISDIKQKFLLKEHLVEHLQPLVKELNERQSISIHIRRGDYLQQHIKEYHGVLGQQYYQNAITKINAEISDPFYFIFSDNINWVKSNLKFEGEIRFISGELTSDHYEDFYLMSQCKHNIIANSSFSWWAAYLNQNARKKVVAPKNWFANTNLNTKDLIPESWIAL